MFGIKHMNQNDKLKGAKMLHRMKNYDNVVKNPFHGLVVM